MRRQPAAASKVRSAAAPSPVRFSDFDSGPPRELGHQLDLRGPALRLPGDVDIFFLAELLFAEFGRTMELGRSGADADVGFAGSGPPRISTPVERSGTYGVIDNDRQILQQLRWGARLRSRRAAPGAALNDQENLAALTWFAALTRAREAGRRDAIFNLLDPLDGPGRCGGSRPRLRR